MKKKINFLAILLLAGLIMPAAASAFWFWNKPAAPVATDKAPIAAELTAAQKNQAEVKYKIWSNSFEKRDVAAVIANQNMFWFTIPELNYIFAQETKKAKKPILTDFTLTDNDGSLAVSANFQQIIKGHFTFNAQIVTNDKRAYLNISKLKLYGLPVPAAWLSKPLNRAINDYFSFLYEDERYQGFSFSDNSGVLKLKPEFK